MATPPPKECPATVTLGTPIVTEQVAQAAGVGAEGVIADRLGRLAVAEQVGGDDVVAFGQRRHHVLPRA